MTGCGEEGEVIDYWWIAEQLWFVLMHRLGHMDVRNFDGSQTEWGSLVRTPIEKP